MTWNHGRMDWIDWWSGSFLVTCGTLRRCCALLRDVMRCCIKMILPGVFPFMFQHEGAIQAGFKLIRYQAAWTIARQHRFAGRKASEAFIVPNENHAKLPKTSCLLVRWVQLWHDQAAQAVCGRECQSSLQGGQKLWLFQSVKLWVHGLRTELSIRDLRRNLFFIGLLGQDPLAVGSRVIYDQRSVPCDV